MRPRKIFFDGVDWSQGDATIAGQLGCNRSWVCRNRKLLCPRDKREAHRQAEQRRRDKFIAQGLRSDGKPLSPKPPAQPASERLRKAREFMREMRRLARMSERERAWHQLRATMNIVCPSWDAAMELGSVDTMKQLAKAA